MQRSAFVTHGKESSTCKYLKCICYSEVEGFPSRACNDNIWFGGPYCSGFNDIRSSEQDDRMKGECFVHRLYGSVSWITWDVYGTELWGHRPPQMKLVVIVKGDFSSSDRSWLFFVTYMHKPFSPQSFIESNCPVLCCGWWFGLAWTLAHYFPFRPVKVCFCQNLGYLCRWRACLDLCKLNAGDMVCM